ncbi:MULTISPECIES: sugar ABC transporter permease [Clostridium]|uniref:sugar ABC transporter permease n=1 Tax=Clostridium TaxID=1485 RepID=UPI001E4ED1A7|nr:MULTISPECIES: sugar ABC transporter permease [Clostridium]MCD2347311.1 sugar ABC transporter permease [Clostridium guangxiense]
MMKSNSSQSELVYKNNVNVREQNNVKQSKLSYKHHLTPSEKRDLWINRIVIWAFILCALYPILFIIGASISKGDAFFSDSIFPKQITFDNYKALFDGSLGDDMNFGRSIINSLKLCTVVCVAQMFMTATSAYAFSRMKFKGRKYGLMSLLIVQMFPMIMTVSAVYVMLITINGIDKIWVVALFLAGGSAFNIWLMKGFIDGLPKELDEAAMVDGATHWQVFTKIILPLSKPMFAVILLLVFIGAYSEFAISSSGLSDSANWTVAITLQHFIDNAFNKHWTQFAAAAVVGSVPQVILFLCLQRFLESGLTAGAVKG